MAQALNSVMLMGFIGNNPEAKIINETPFCKFRLATNHRFRNYRGEYETKTEWHNVVIWGSQASFTVGRLKKGEHIYVKGKLSHRNYLDKSGKKRTVTEVRATEIISLAPNMEILQTRRDLNAA